MPPKKRNSQSLARSSDFEPLLKKFKKASGLDASTYESDKLLSFLLFCDPFRNLLLYTSSVVTAHVLTCLSKNYNEHLLSILKEAVECKKRPGIATEYEAMAKICDHTSEFIGVRLPKKLSEKSRTIKSRTEFTIELCVYHRWNDLIPEFLFVPIHLGYFGAHLVAALIGNLDYFDSPFFRATCKDNPYIDGSAVKILVSELYWRLPTLKYKKFVAEVEASGCLDDFLRTVRRYFTQTTQHPHHFFKLSLAFGVGGFPDPLSM
jgi:hypothetical protein